ncbi:hypothetical protein F5X68DRAFT_237992 [Plectosphaerella plurivora]|uniref:Glycosyl transferase n=1 Tax=Plectosphaerella plurivora TaxID=936078 RepID=A0A9P8UUX9_9PEZI|nr:hypothetical protein F5X68DRAFT_237992 [Plectosphaerella plurivora]
MRHLIPVLHTRVILSLMTLVTLSSLLYFLPDPRSFLPPLPTCDSSDPKNAIPNYVHYVYILPESHDGFDFRFSHFLSIYAAWYYWRPDTIYLHTNVRDHGEEVSQAREGRAGKWSKMIFTLFDLRIRTVDVPSHAGNGVEIKNMEHKSDFVRVKAVYELGGIYIDWDVHPLRDIKILRQSGFRAVAGRQMDNQVNSGTFMSVRHGKMVKLWMNRMNIVYDGGWTTHSNEVITSCGQQLVREAGEMLIMERDAFAPGSWTNKDTDALFGFRGESSNPANVNEGDALPALDETLSDRWDNPDKLPDWAHDWSHTYLLHAFSPDRWKHQVFGFENITPQYILNQTSNFALATYPIASHLYANGLIRSEDTYTGR